MKKATTTPGDHWTVIGHYRWRQYEIVKAWGCDHWTVHYETDDGLIKTVARRFDSKNEAMDWCEAGEKTEERDGDE